MLMAKEGYPFLLISTLITALAFWIWPYLAIPFFVLTLFVAYFFRDPERVSPENAQVLVSPADGVVVEVKQLIDDKFLKGPAKRIGIFMSPLNVHVNRSPAEGVVKEIIYTPGKFLIASRDKASEDNERNAVILECKHSQKRIAFVQIAGFVARRIVSYIKPGDFLKQGERFGIIRFGSRVDVYLPIEAEILIQMKQKVKAGETELARLSAASL